MAERDALANEAQSRVTPNPVLSEYMNRGAQQGLVPRRKLCRWLYYVCNKCGK